MRAWSPVCCWSCHETLSSKGHAGLCSVIFFPAPGTWLLVIQPTLTEHGPSARHCSRSWQQGSTPDRQNPCLSDWARSTAAGGLAEGLEQPSEQKGAAWGVKGPGRSSTARPHSSVSPPLTVPPTLCPPRLGLRGSLALSCRSGWEPLPTEGMPALGGLEMPPTS